MIITQQHVQNLLGLFSHGLINGAGSTEHTNEFCIQQAVHRVIDDDLFSYSTDSAPESCILPEINALAITMNDCGHWNSEMSRAKGLQRFGIAELGSAKIDWDVFAYKLEEKIQAISPKAEFFNLNRDDNAFVEDFMELRPDGMTRNTWITVLANMMADVLKELKTQGSKFLWMVDEPDREKREAAAFKLGDKMYANQMADARNSCNFGSNCSFGLPPKGHHFHKPSPKKK